MHIIRALSNCIGKNEYVELEGSQIQEESPLMKLVSSLWQLVSLTELAISNSISVSTQIAFGTGEPSSYFRNICVNYRTLWLN